MIFVISVFNVPFLILIWLIEAYILLLVVRLMLAWIPSVSQSHLYQRIAVLTDVIPTNVSRSLRRFTDSSVPSWVSWVIVLISACALRQLLMSILVVHIIQQS